MSLRSWGNYPQTQNQPLDFVQTQDQRKNQSKDQSQDQRKNQSKDQNKDQSKDQKNNLSQIIQQHQSLIPRGNGRSYGDSALAEHIIQVKPHDLFLDFDPCFNGE